jgi:4-diphosphocytidyl-2-C-methyl-D-erythritol kinase
VAAGTGEALRAPALAKINLYLHVTGRRDDGYHLLDSLIVFAGVGDTVAATAADDLTLSVAGPRAAGLPTGPDNLVLKAALALRDAAGITKGAHLTLTKRLPAASGIGGGSADAAAALRVLSRLWGGIEESTLSRIALGTGADVPVCLAGRAANVSGIGERLDPAPMLPPAWLLLVNPGVGVSTPAVFKARKAGFSQAQPITGKIRDAAALAVLLRERTNDLAAPAEALAPVIKTALAAIGDLGGVLLARMSGSGATCFGLCADETSAQAAAATLRALHPGWWIAAAPMVSDSRAFTLD